MKKISVIILFLIFLSLNNVASDVYRVTNDTAASQNCIAVADDSGHLYLFWQDNRSGSYEIYYEKIDINATPSFGNATKISSSGGDAINPSVALVGDVLHVVWQDNRDGNWEIYYKNLTTDGEIFPEDIRITNTVGESVEPSISAKNDIIFITWAEEENNTYTIHYYNVASIPCPDTTPPTIEITTPANNSNISILNNTVVGSVTDNSGISIVNLSVNGMLQHSWTTSGSFSKNVSYILGQWNNISITAEDTSGNIKTVVVYVYVTEPSLNVTVNLTAPSEVELTEDNGTVTTTSTEIKFYANASGKVNIIINASTNISLLEPNISNENFYSNASYYGLVGLNKFIKIDVSGAVNETNNVSWVVIKIHYTYPGDLDRNGDGDANDVGDINENDLVLMRYCPATQTWQPVRGSSITCGNDTIQIYTPSTVNTSQHYVWVNVSHFSVYGLGGSIIQAQTPSSVSSSGGEYQPKVTILANNIDLSLAKEFISYLEQNGIKVYTTDKNNFSIYNEKPYVIILGGHEAYEGIGEIVSNIMTEEERNNVKQGKMMIKKRDIYRSGQVVYILAGKDREATAQVWKENKEEIMKVIKYNWG